LPVGNLFVIPKDFRTFSKDVKLELYVNGALRQRALVGSTFWDFDEILTQIWAQRDATWEHKGDQVPLFEGQNVIDARVMILSGTPEGTIFSDLSWAQKLSGVVSWVFGGWYKSVPDHAIERYIIEARKAAVYLQPDDEVIIHVDHLGVIFNRITGGN
jgi:2-keto-4-pentenoate hydratase/2-oxohepta-3-ene-1,7-dioic acid hydratase in catechol pathway